MNNPGIIRTGDGKPRDHGRVGRGGGDGAAGGGGPRVAAADPHGRGVGGSVRGRAVAGRSRGRARDRGRDRATKKRRRFDTRGTREIEERSHCLPIRHIINQFRHLIYTVSRSNAPFLEPITSLSTAGFPRDFPSRALQKRRRTREGMKFFSESVVRANNPSFSHARAPARAASTSPPSHPHAPWGAMMPPRLPCKLVRACPMRRVRSPPPVSGPHLVLILTLRLVRDNRRPAVVSARRRLSPRDASLDVRPAIESSIARSRGAPGRRVGGRAARHSRDPNLATATPAAFSRPFASQGTVKFANRGGFGARCTYRIFSSPPNSLRRFPFLAPRSRQHLRRRRGIPHREIRFIVH